ncbi:DNA repair protein RecO [Candidatus Uhrbacteria bacterium RIFCSPLOWO2_01_FULL_53_9]|uniref:DNA repair protein RecO n=3 Tax=Candidatus Uhriibacteriota TaxID=1752732 RepID=A0A1F7V0C7_9BACT|nr:MAG: DNA repair protein RecO [Candidatus Uhrbacteria bacterium RIFCSPHIGHO2_02_FULL_53_13]OGL83464.1 MAG: DNA repair protein RecO [Candidatus Uhrbacteria bacterium RIFCSPLOWO2_01_FULL_53_9]OGL89084.1 MAG: DNA repair protein RecO [Candidatus Uhrbacteria bacterium RIFCSPLOWO2_02_FULL_53_10]
MTSIITAVVLGSRDYKDYDRFYDLYTKERGKVMVFGKGTRKFQSKLAAHMQPFAELTCMVAHGKLWLRLAGVERRRDFPGVRRDLQTLGLGLGLNELLRVGVGSGESDASLYAFLLDAYAWVDALSPPSRHRTAFIHSAITLKWLILLGVGPHCDACVICHCELERVVQPHISVMHGGLVCTKCVQQDRPRFADARRVSHELVSALRFLAMAPFDVLLSRSFEPLLNDLAVVQDQFVTYHLERELNTTAFIYDLNDQPIAELA